MALRVLLADESSTIKRVFEISLKDLGLEIKSVQHGIDVIEVAESFQPDIIFADVLVSKMNGYEVCAQVKQHPQLSSVPVVLMWSSFMDIDEDKYSACNADGRLEKPFSNDQLRARIQSLVPRTLDNPVAEHIRFSNPTTETPNPNAIKRRKDPTEDLLYKEDLPLELPEEEEFSASSNDDFLDPEALNSALDESLNNNFNVADSEDFNVDSDPEVTDVDLDLRLDDTNEDLSYDEDDSSVDDFGLDGFQALDITGSYNENLNERWGDTPSEFVIENTTADDEVPLDFTPPTPAFDHDEPEITEIPSLEEEVELLQKASEDTAIRRSVDLHATAPAHQNTAASIKHRSIDELTDPGLIDEMPGASSSNDLPPVPQKSTVHSDPKAAAEILISKEELRALVHKEAKAMLQSVIWDVVPELAKQMIEKELKRLLAEEEPPQA